MRSALVRGRPENMDTNELLSVIINVVKNDISEIKSKQERNDEKLISMQKDIERLEHEYDEVLKVQREIRTWLVRLTKYIAPMVTCVLATMQILILLGVRI
jgi:hypothetical protein